MKMFCSRREFIRATALALPTGTLFQSLAAAPAPSAFSFVLLGDLHFDRLDDHDAAWLRANHPNDVRQVEDYSRITRDVSPALWATLRHTIADLNRSPDTRVAFVLQAGDLVEGLCGTEALALRQNNAVVARIREAQLGVPLVFTKGNHDITGPGAAGAFQTVFHPFLAEQARAVDRDAARHKACLAFRYGDTLYCCYDAYDEESLDWLEATLAKRTEQHCFLLVHPPVVPFGARSTWHIYSNPKQQLRREKLLDLLAQHRVFVLCGHIHVFSALVREVPRGGRFLQLAVNSVIGSPQVTPKEVLSGTGQYTADQIKVEPNFSPETEPQRRAVYAAEAPRVRYFEYANLPGYAVITVNGANVEARVCSGATRTTWKTLRLSELLRA